MKFSQIRTDIIIVIEDRILVQMGPQPIQPDKWTK